jgi:hypothetical protein
MPITLHFKGFSKRPASNNPLTFCLPNHGLVGLSGYQGLRIGTAISLLESPEIRILVRQAILDAIDITGGTGPVVIPSINSQSSTNRIALNIAPATGEITDDSHPGSSRDNKALAERLWLI